MDISELLEDDEKENVEFKSSLSLYNDIVTAISSFSNKRGGTILVGVNDDRDVIGVGIGSNTLENLANDIRRDTDPPVFPYIDYSEVDGKTVIAIEVSENPNKPVFFRDKAYIRVGRSNQRLSSAEIRSLITNENNVTSWDQQVLEDATYGNIDKKRLINFLKEAQSRRNLDLDPKMPIEEALDRLNLLKNGKLTNAAILLFGSKPQRFVLQATTKCAKFSGIEPEKFDDVHVFEGTIIDQRNDALRFVEKYTKRSADIEGSDRVEEFEYPLEAIREALSNALCHRDYRINCNVQLRIFDDRIEIWGCGPLPQPLTVDDLKINHNSIPRNPLIADCFFKTGFIEQWGTGTERIISSCLENGLPEPEFEIKSGNLVVTINKFKFVDFKGQLNERQNKALDYIKINGKITNREYREINNVKRSMTITELKDLVEKRLITPQGKGAATYYVLV